MQVLNEEFLTRLDFYVNTIDAKQTWRPTHCHIHTCSVYYTFTLTFDADFAIVRREF